MGLIESFEKLINEHGSAAILREHLALLKAQQSALERKSSDLESQAKKLQSENMQLQEQIEFLRSQLKSVQSGNPSGYVCDHCGSPMLKRTGNRPDPIFGDVGVKQALFNCMACNKQSAFTQNP